ncbi:RNA helicase [Marispirochaeta aestuarii]|uniref:RNA helicase n=1 Tax=Marispirochaeta aestuarii TaxID=1963862 RepID=A0A1Y1S2T7_9SPIO|nr:helicase-related protein [Marispirochaeta aestuarii]ORC37386.1 RNA helicase [Marispirochaeta aestuarii]
MTLEQLKVGSRIRGLQHNGAVEIIQARWHGSDVVELTWRDDDGYTETQLVYRSQEQDLSLVEGARLWSFTAESEKFILASEAMRIQLAYLFDPLLAVNTSDVDPLPHQISAVYEHMLQRQPLRFLLADDPGAGKTIMAGLLIKELMMRGDVQRCMVVCPGSLVEQWQDELDEKFSLPFEILTNDKLQSSRTGNWFLENNLVICRLDKLSRDEDLQDKLKVSDWDLIICDEAHKMSATFFGNEVKYTKRFRLGQMLSNLTRHFLLMTATPHNGKEEDYQLFLSLIDADRFEGKPRKNNGSVEASDLMRRLVKEQLVKMDGTRLFPERRAYTVQYRLSDEEVLLYEGVTSYVREQFNRAEKIINQGRKGNIGFALTILQRRLASSPAAIYRSLHRRRERLEDKLREMELLHRSFTIAEDSDDVLGSDLDEELDLDDFTGEEAEELEDQLIDRASASRSIEELKKEIIVLSALEKQARKLLDNGHDKKWQELSSILQDNPQMFTPEGTRRKLVIFTEHRDTLAYLEGKLKTSIGNDESIVSIYGGMLRQERKKAENLFRNDPDVHILLATDAAGEGINLQRGHLMVNYDLPWNPNRLEQRFGRIHRIGQTEVCHLWNLVAFETREGDVFFRLLSKIEKQKEDLGDQVFDVLGDILRGNALRDLLIEAIRDGDRPEVRNRIYEKIDHPFEHGDLQKILAERALSQDVLATSTVEKIRDMMERARARKLQPHFIREFFLRAFSSLGGDVRKREEKRYQINHVPAAIRNQDRIIGSRSSVLRRYERICFDRKMVHLPGKPDAEFIAPGHPLLSAIIDLVLQQNRHLFKEGAVLIDERDEASDTGLLVYLDHSIADGTRRPSGGKTIVSRRMEFVRFDHEGNPSSAGPAPYLDLRAADDTERNQALEMFGDFLGAMNVEELSRSYAITELIPAHMDEIKSRREDMIRKIHTQVRLRLTREIMYWDNKGQQLKLAENAGKKNAKINSRKAFDRADELSRRLEQREAELENQRLLTPLAPNVLAAALVVPAAALYPERGTITKPDQEGRRRIELLAMQQVLIAEQKAGRIPVDVSADNRGWDIESRDPETGTLLLIEVKGRAQDAQELTVTHNEVLQGFNASENFILALVRVAGVTCDGPYYIRRPFEKEPDWADAGKQLRIKKLLERAEDPAMISIRMNG